MAEAETTPPTDPPGSPPDLAARLEALSRRVEAARTGAEARAAGAAQAAAPAVSGRRPVGALGLVAGLAVAGTITGVTLASTDGHGARVSGRPVASPTQSVKPPVGGVAGPGTRFQPEPAVAGATGPLRSLPAPGSAPSSPATTAHVAAPTLAGPTLIASGGGPGSVPVPTTTAGLMLPATEVATISPVPATTHPPAITPEPATTHVPATTRTPVTTQVPPTTQAPAAAVSSPTTAPPIQVPPSTTAATVDFPAVASAADHGKADGRSHAHEEHHEGHHGRS